MAKLNRPSVARKPLALALSALCLGGLATGPVAAASGAGGTNFHAAGSNGEAVVLAFSRDGRRVARAFLSYAVRCSDGDQFVQTFTLDELRVSPRGSFKAVFDTGMVPSETGSESRRAQLTLTGRRTRSRVIGTSRLTLEHVVGTTGARVTCDSGLMKYVALD